MTTENRMAALGFRRWPAVACLAALLGCVAAVLAWEPPAETAPAQQPAAEQPASEQPTRPPHRTLTLRGEVVFLGEALQRRYGIVSDADAMRTSAALECADGRLIPLVKDSRGRGFLLDERLRDRPLELVLRQYEGAPAAQVMRVLSLQGEERYEVDYWCDICAIPMYELKACECCQGPIRFRERLVDKRGQLVEP